ncbi:MAG: ADP-forming succinate--CoA ligase subunit beta [Gammaproteobacteria bacterium]
MNLHEYQAKQLFSDYGIPVPEGKPTRSITEAVQVAKALGGTDWVVKAQIHAGGRGKSGGVKLADNLDDVENYTREMLSKNLITKQTGPEGQPVHCVMIQSLTNIKSELYLSMLVDRVSKRLAIMVSLEGGVNIEEVAEQTPEKILTVTIDPIMGLQAYQSHQLGYALGLNQEQRSQLYKILKSLYQLFMEKDLSLIEINPFIIDDNDQLIALDAKITIDDSALFRQPELAEWRDPEQEDPLESEAKRFNLSFVRLDGNIGCMVNGAGLAMATMDIIKLHGGSPANFLDVGGGTTAEKVAEAFKLILSEKKIKAILVNIFGGIVRCDLIADGVIKAVQDVGINIPVIVRLEGTNVEQGKALLKESGLDIVSAEGFDDAARQVVAAAKGEL